MDLTPWLIEVHTPAVLTHYLINLPLTNLLLTPHQVNVACSLASSSPLDKRIKNLLMTDMSPQHVEPYP